MAHLEAMTHTGFHSDIYQGNLPSGTPFLTKHYGEKAHGFEPDKAREITGHIRRFVTQAQGLGIPVVQPFGHYIEKNGHPGKVNLIEMVPMAGKDLRARFGNPAVSDREVMRDIGAYLDLFNTTWKAGFPISLDPPPANFCRDTNGNLSYIDNMPPRQRLADGAYITEWPVPPDDTADFIQRRYFSPQQAEVIYPQLLRAVDGRAITPDAIKFAIGAKLGIDAFRQIDITEDEQARLLAAPGPEDVDKLRILAAEKRSIGAIDPGRFKEVYHLTHIGVGGLLPAQDDLRHAVSLLAA